MKCIVPATAQPIKTLETSQLGRIPTFNVLYMLLQMVEIMFCQWDETLVKYA